MTLHVAKHMVGNVHMHQMSCHNCRAEWRVYSIIEETTTEMLFDPFVAVDTETTNVVDTESATSNDIDVPDVQEDI